MSDISCEGRKSEVEKITVANLLKYLQNKTHWNLWSKGNGKFVIRFNGPRGPKCKLTWKGKNVILKPGGGGGYQNQREKKMEIELPDEFVHIPEGHTDFEWDDFDVQGDYQGDLDDERSEELGDIMDDAIDLSDDAVRWDSTNFHQAQILLQEMKELRKEIQIMSDVTTLKEYVELDRKLKDIKSASSSEDTKFSLKLDAKEISDIQDVPSALKFNFENGNLDIIEKELSNMCLMRDSGYFEEIAKEETSLSSENSEIKEEQKSPENLEVESPKSELCGEGNKVQPQKSKQCTEGIEVQLPKSEPFVPLTFDEAADSEFGSSDRCSLMMAAALGWDSELNKNGDKELDSLIEDLRVIIEAATPVDFWSGSKKRSFAVVTIGSKKFLVAQKELL